MTTVSLVTKSWVLGLGHGVGTLELGWGVGVGHGSWSRGAGAQGLEQESWVTGAWGSLVIDSSLPELDSVGHMRSVLEIHPWSYILLPSQIKLCSMIQGTQSH